ncbi:hypothetical protein OSTOST_25205, partial [Ostertagia ostertagi]
MRLTRDGQLLEGKLAYFAMKLYILLTDSLRLYRSFRGMYRLLLLCSAALSTTRCAKRARLESDHWLQPRSTILSPIMDSRVEMVGHTSSILQIPYESKYMDHEGYSKLEVKSSSFWEVPTQGRSMSVSDFEGFVRNMQSLYRG